MRSRTCRKGGMAGAEEMEILRFAQDDKVHL
jgi:hypothetical protein